MNNEANVNVCMWMWLRECDCVWVCVSECVWVCVSILAGRRNALNPRTAARTISVHCAGNSSQTTNTNTYSHEWVCVCECIYYIWVFICMHIVYAVKGIWVCVRAVRFGILGHILVARHATLGRVHYLDVLPRLENAHTNVSAWPPFTHAHTHTNTRTHMVYANALLAMCMCISMCWFYFQLLQLQLPLLPLLLLLLLLVTSGARISMFCYLCVGNSYLFAIRLFSLHIHNC